MAHFLNELYVNIVLTTPLVGAYTMFALGIVFIYRASRVLNLAHGSMAMVPAYIAYSVSPVLGAYAAALVAVVAGAALGAGVERLVVRRLRGSNLIAQTVGTVGVFGLLIAVAAKVWGTTPVQGVHVFPEHALHVGAGILHVSDVGLLLVALFSVGVFLAVFRFTDLGLAMRCAADNRRAARLMGIDPDRTTAMAWMFAGALAALGGVLLSQSTNLDPYTLSLQVLPAFVAALIGGLENVAGALVGSVIVGLVIGVAFVLPGIGQQVGAPQLALTLGAFVVMALRGKRFSVTEVASE